jgi:hypothetical protein
MVASEIHTRSPSTGASRLSAGMPQYQRRNDLPLYFGSVGGQG